MYQTSWAFQHTDCLSHAIVDWGEGWWGLRGNRGGDVLHEYEEKRKQSSKRSRQKVAHHHGEVAQHHDLLKGQRLPTIMEMLPSIMIFSKLAQHNGFVAHHHDLAVSLLLRGCPSSSSTSFTSSHQPEAIRNKNLTSNKGNLQSWFFWRTKTTFVASAVFTQKSRFLVSGGKQVATTVALRGFIIPLGRILGVGDFGQRMG